MKITEQREIAGRLKDNGELETAELFKEADSVRKKYAGSQVHLRGIIEFSNYCRRDCLYCGLRAGNRHATRYRMSPEEIISCAGTAAALKIPTVVLQSGEDAHYSTDDLCRIVASIKKLGLAVTLSVGERPYEAYRSLKEAGCDRYLLRFETSDEALYERLRPGRKLKDRINCLEHLKKLDYQTGSGIMIGLPGQTPESIAGDILLFKSLELDMIGVGPFLPHPRTPLSGEKTAALESVLKVIALTRIITKDTHIPATTAVGTMDSRGRQRALACGANIIMPNITPAEYRRFYEIYPDKICVDEDAFKCRGCVEKMIKSAGRQIGEGFGHSLKRKNQERACQISGKQS